VESLAAQAQRSAALLERLIMNSTIRIPVALALLAVSSLCVAQKPTDKPNEDWWYNFASAPVRFDRTRKSDKGSDYNIGLRNRSSKYVTDYDFGCVELNGDQITITKRFWGSSITDGGYAPRFLWPPFGPKDTDKDEAYANGMCKDSKIAVVWVVFDGGGYWAAPGVVNVKRSL